MKTVPVCATSNSPSLLRWAPVNAPFSWPKSSLSISVVGRVAEFTTTNGLSLLGLPAQMARATSSLPVPLSPSINTELCEGAQREISRLTASIAGACPMISASGEPRAAMLR